LWLGPLAIEKPLKRKDAKRGSQRSRRKAGF
jgi:hypothetical protein